MPVGLFRIAHGLIVLIQHFCGQLGGDAGLDSIFLNVGAGRSGHAVDQVDQILAFHAGKLIHSRHPHGLVLGGVAAHGDQAVLGNGDPFGGVFQVPAEVADGLGAVLVIGLGSKQEGVALDLPAHKRGHRDRRTAVVLGDLDSFGGGGSADDDPLGAGGLALGGNTDGDDLHPVDELQGAVVVNVDVFTAGQVAGLHAHDVPLAVAGVIDLGAVLVAVNGVQHGPCGPVGEGILLDLDGGEHAGAAVQGQNGSAAYGTGGGNHLHIGLGGAGKDSEQAGVRVDAHVAGRAAQTPAEFQVLHLTEILVHAHSLILGRGVAAAGNIQGAVAAVGALYLHLTQLGLVAAEGDLLFRRSFGRGAVAHRHVRFHGYRVQGRIVTEPAGGLVLKIGVPVGGGIHQGPPDPVVPQHLLAVLVESHGGKGEGRPVPGNVIVFHLGAGENGRLALHHQNGGAGLAGIHFAGHHADLFGQGLGRHAYRAPAASLLNGHAAGGILQLPLDVDGVAGHFISVLVVDPGGKGRLVFHALFAVLQVGDHHRAGTDAGDFHPGHMLLAVPAEGRGISGNTAGRGPDHHHLGAGIQHQVAGIGIFVGKIGIVTISLDQLPGNGTLLGHLVAVLIQPQDLHIHEQLVLGQGGLLDLQGGIDGRLPDNIHDSAAVNAAFAVAGIHGHGHLRRAASHGEHTGLGHGNAVHAVAERPDDVGVLDLHAILVVGGGDKELLGRRIAVGHLGHLQAAVGGRGDDDLFQAPVGAQRDLLGIGERIGIPCVSCHRDAYVHRAAAVKGQHGGAVGIGFQRCRSRHGGPGDHRGRGLAHLLAELIPVPQGKGALRGAGREAVLHNLHTGEHGGDPQNGKGAIADGVRIHPILLAGGNNAHVGHGFRLAAHGDHARLGVDGHMLGSVLQRPADSDLRSIAVPEPAVLVGLVFHAELIVNTGLKGDLLRVGIHAVDHHGHHAGAELHFHTGGHGGVPGNGDLHIARTDLGRRNFHSDADSALVHMDQAGGIVDVDHRGARCRVGAGHGPRLGTAGESFPAVLVVIDGGQLGVAGGQQLLLADPQRSESGAVLGQHKFDDTENTGGLVHCGHNDLAFFRRAGNRQHAVLVDGHALRGSAGHQPFHVGERLAVIERAVVLIHAVGVEAQGAGLILSYHGAVDLLLGNGHGAAACGALDHDLLQPGRIAVHPDRRSGGNGALGLPGGPHLHGACPFKEEVAVLAVAEERRSIVAYNLPLDLAGLCVDLPVLDIVDHGLQPGVLGAYGVTFVVDLNSVGLKASPVPGDVNKGLAQNAGLVILGYDGHLLSGGGVNGYRQHALLAQRLGRGFGDADAFGRTGQAPDHVFYIAGAHLFPVLVVRYRFIGDGRGARLDLSPGSGHAHGFYLDAGQLPVARVIQPLPAGLEALHAQLDQNAPGLGGVKQVVGIARGTGIEGRPAVAGSLAVHVGPVQHFPGDLIAAGHVFHLVAELIVKDHFQGQRSAKGLVLDGRQEILQNPRGGKSALFLLGQNAETGGICHAAAAVNSGKDHAVLRLCHAADGDHARFPVHRNSGGGGAEAPVELGVFDLLLVLVIHLGGILYHSVAAAASGHIDGDITIDLGDLHPIGPGRVAADRDGDGQGIQRRDLAVVGLGGRAGQRRKQQVQAGGGVAQQQDAVAFGDHSGLFGAGFFPSGSQQLPGSGSVFNLQGVSVLVVVFIFQFDGLCGGRNGGGGLHADPHHPGVFPFHGSHGSGRNFPGARGIYRCLYGNGPLGRQRVDLQPPGGVVRRIGRTRNGDAGRGVHHAPGDGVFPDEVAL